MSDVHVIKSRIAENHKLYAEEKSRVAFVSYPRSGSNWACAILAELMKRAVVRGQTIGLTGKQGAAICPIDSGVRSFAEEKRHENYSGVVKTHRHLWDHKTCVIYMFRDARETLASFRHWTRQQKPASPINTWSDTRYVRVFLRQLIVSWLRTIAFALRHPQNIVLIPYKELLYRPLRPLQNMMRFVGISLSDDELLEVYRDYGLHNMQKKRPGLVYREAKANKGDGDFSRPILWFIATLSWLPHTVLCLLAQRRFWRLTGATTPGASEVSVRR